MKKKFYKISSRALIATLLFSVAFSFAGCTQKTVARADDTEYVILMLTDLHLEDDKNYQKRAFRTMDELVELSKPDFIIVTGDVNDVFDCNDKIFTAFGEKMESYEIPWTFTFGNHDAQGSAWSKKDIADYLESLRYCKFEKGPDDVYGYGNNYFNVTDENGKIIQTIFTIDTSGPETGTHPVDKSQIDWYKGAVRDIAVEANGDPSKVVPSIMFTHIPMREYKEAYDEAKKNKKIVYGKRREKECPDENEDELLETIVSLGSTTAYYCGHEHKNNYVVYKDGIRLSYGETCRHKSYIPSRGGLIVNVKKDGRVTQQNVRRSSASRIYKISEEY